MKIIEAINRIDELKTNMYSIEAKISWLNRLDSKIYQEIICTHQYNDGEEEVEFTGYGPEDQETELLVGEPYAEMYLHWLAAQIDYNNMEYDNFNNANSMFDSVYSSFRNAYNASHMPKQSVKYYF